MGARINSKKATYSLAAAAPLLVAAALSCSGNSVRTSDTNSALAKRVVADFEKAVKTDRAAYVALFDFAKVGEYEILLRRHDYLGRITDLSPPWRAELANDDGTPFSEERERTNVGNFYPLLAQRTVGTGGCTLQPPRSDYTRKLGQPFADLAPLPAGDPAKELPGAYKKLQTAVNSYLATGGIVTFACAGGKGALALVFTASSSERGYDLITIYDDVVQ